ncbi:hypothetical protein [Xylanibacillus composti]|uniref:Uncharacterized protein n=1 Tax=Xylanibacillus composti TaxID=1572762 RepID=A0A8J4M4R9_9BACL|nr:hypothetical protein [Xylanibacillus composti]GIQ71016.1 hypothetical protein XYCOK13_38400 [Xylanibacillus composti]
MRTLLITLLLLTAVMLIYSATIGGADGALHQLNQSNEKVKQRIQSLNP